VISERYDRAMWIVERRKMGGGCEVERVELTAELTRAHSALATFAARQALTGSSWLSGV